jgi:hypothetical protein
MAQKREPVNMQAAIVPPCWQQGKNDARHPNGGGGTALVVCLTDLLLFLLVRSRWSHP